MASYQMSPDRRTARIIWRIGRVQMTKSIRVAHDREAQRACSLVVETLQDIARGKLTIPEGVDPRMFVFTGAKVAPVPTMPAIRSGPALLADLFASYRVSPPPHLEPSTRRMVEIHFRRLAESAPTTSLRTFDRGAAQAYVTARTAVSFRGRAIGRETIAKELKSFRQAWVWVASRTPGMAGPTWAVGDLSFPKGKAAHPFMTWGEIERESSRGGLTDREIGELWDCLWLDRDQVREFLGHVRTADAPPWLAPMVVAAAFTGGRRSELCRSRVGDWDLDAFKGRLQKKKRDKEVEFSFRDVPVHPQLATALRDWFGRHPGGVFAFAQPDAAEATWDMASHHFRAALAGSKWADVRGWHLLRHSFASNLASAGVDQRLIDAWMGHSTEIRWRYQHLRPKDQRDAIGVL